MSVLSLTFNDKWENVTHRYDNGHFDLAMDDVPYGIQAGKLPFVTTAKSYVRQPNGKRLLLPKKAYKQNDWDKKPPPQEYFDEIRRISRHQIIFGVDYCDWQGVGPGRIIWDKCLAKGLSFSRTETAYCSFIEHQHTIKLLWSGMMQAGSLANPTRQQANKKLNEKRIHPCHKPVLIYLALLNYYREILGQLPKKVIDTHLGSGSSRIACDRINCDFVGVEADPIHFVDEENRWKDYHLLKQPNLGFHSSILLCDNSSRPQ